MKLKITCAFLALAGTSFGALVSLSSVGSNYNGTDDYGILLSNGTPVAQGAGIARAGYFTISDSLVASLAGSGDYATLFATGNFVTVTSDDFTGINAAYGANAGFVSGSISNYDAAGRNNTLYCYFTSGTDLGLIKTTSTLVPDLGGTSPEFSYLLNFATGVGQGTALIGAAGPTYQVAYNGLGPAPTNVQSFQLAAVPEPSAALLGALGALGLLRRRRN
ncbi:MAG: hypothetical protein V4640_13525 [Verrucomicrobiota bacterium]